jgi:hypothetical protein
VQTKTNPMKGTPFLLDMLICWCVEQEQTAFTVLSYLLQASARNAHNSNTPEATAAAMGLKHAVRTVKLNRDSAHRQALFRNQVCF